MAKSDALPLLLLTFKVLFLYEKGGVSWGLLTEKNVLMLFTLKLGIFFNNCYTLCKKYYLHENRQKFFF